VGLNFGYGDGPGRAHLDAALAPQALVLGYHNGLAVLHFEDTHRTHINAFFIARAFVSIHFHTPRHKSLPPLKIGYFIVLVGIFP
jgi:hypothetical protein